jgi:hypothetical protein
MIARIDTWGMYEAIFLIVILALCIAAPFFGVDSRWQDNGGHHRRNI